MESSKKPTVTYKGRFGTVEVGRRAIVTGLKGHPRQGLDLDGAVVETSTVVAFDEATGRIETRNTIYVPE